MKYYNLAPNVLCATARNRVLKKNQDGGFPENWWDEGDADKMVKDGFLVEIGAQAVEVPVETPVVNPKGEAEVKKPVGEKLNFVSTTIDQLKEILSLRGITFEEDAKKPELWKLYKG